MHVFAGILTSILHNSLLHDDRDHFYQDLLKVLEIGATLNLQKDLKNFVLNAKSQMQLLFNVNKLRIYLYNQENNLFKFYDEKSNEFVVVPARFGIACQVLKSLSPVAVACAENHPQYNGSVL